MLDTQGTIQSNNVSQLWSSWKNRSYEDITSYTLGMQLPLMSGIIHHILRECMISRLMRVTRNRKFKRAVDLGCATGEWTIAYGRLAERVVGVDINESFIEEAKCKIGDSAEASRIDMHAMNLVDYDDYKDVDLVCSGGCLMYIDDDSLDNLISKISESIEPGGYVYIRVSVPNPRRKTYYTPKGFYREASFYEKLCNNHGLEIVDAASSGTVIGHELLRELLKKQGNIRFDTTIQEAVRTVLYMRQLLQKSKRNHHMNWLMQCKR
ncbi:MAG: class I SAM-dependent methyltransferase [Deltaproteobacteria bacterium]|nr:class I SAM-dependent methyltransferase [Deltaproteobacteria bacterium]